MMKAAFKFGLTPESTVDWRGRLAAAIWLPQCSFRCPFCHNGELVKGNLDVAYSLEEVIEEVISKRQGLLQGVVLSGGEPLFSVAQCDAVCEAIGGRLPIKLDTNGSFPESFTDFVERWKPDYVAIDIKGAPENYAEVAGLSVPPRMLASSVMATLETALAFEVPHVELRTTVIPGLNDEDAPAIAEWVGHLAPYITEYSVQAFQPGRCLDRFFNRVQATPADMLQHFAGVIKGAGFNAQITHGAVADTDIEALDATTDATGTADPSGSAILAEDLE